MLRAMFCLHHLVKEMTLNMVRVFRMLGCRVVNALDASELESRMRSTNVDLQIESCVILCRIRNEECTSHLSELSMRLFDLVQPWMLCRYGCMCDFAVCMFCCMFSNCDVVCIGYELCLCLEE